MSVHPAAPSPCDACPWRIANHGQRHPDGWYTARNRDRLWAKLRRGDSMSCHPTDPRNPVPEGHRAAPEDAKTRECAGALILQQREWMLFQEEHAGDVAGYRRARPRGLTREGLMAIAARSIRWPGDVEMSTPDLNQPVSHPPLGAWTPPVGARS